MHTTSKKPHVNPRRNKPKAKAPTPEAQTKRLFQTLVKQIDNGHHTNAIRTCDKILKIYPTDSDALQTKVFLLLQTGEYGRALELIDSLGDAYEYERAYAMYGMHKLEGAWELVSKAEKERGIMHMEAQLNYRQGKYADCVDVYNQLLDTCDSGTDEYSDILTNLQAAQSHLDFITTSYMHSLQGIQAPSGPPAVVSAQILSPPTTTAPKPTTIKAPRLPKGVIAGVTPLPDPERWVKKSERTNAFRNKRKGAAAMTQGASLAPETPSVGLKSTGGAPKGKGKKR